MTLHAEISATDWVAPAFTLGGVLLGGVLSFLVALYTSRRSRGQHALDEAKQAAEEYLGACGTVVVSFSTIFTRKDLLEARTERLANLMDRVVGAHVRLESRCGPALRRLGDDLWEVVGEAAQFVANLHVKWQLPGTVRNVTDEPGWGPIMERWRAARGNFLVVLSHPLD